MWLTLEEERRQRKWTNWSAHFAWGALLVFVGVGFHWPLGLAYLAAMGVMVLFEVGHPLLHWRPSAVDTAASIMGSTVALFYVLLFWKGGPL
jgi:hypothetical protein